MPGLSFTKVNRARGHVHDAYDRLLLATLTNDANHLNHNVEDAIESLAYAAWMLGYKLFYVDTDEKVYVTPDRKEIIPIPEAAE
jgi:hypothetical protein